MIPHVWHHLGWIYGLTSICTEKAKKAETVQSAYKVLLLYPIWALYLDEILPLALHMLALSVCLSVCLNDWVVLQMSSIINAAYWQRLFSMLSSNLIKMLKVKRNILIKIKFWSFVLKTLKYISIYRYFKLILNFRHGFKLSKDDSIKSACR